MMSVGTKLAFWIVVFPISLMITLFAGIIYLYHPTFEALIIVEIISTLSSVVLVDLLVWERLRKSLFDKLEYCHEEYLVKLHNDFNRGGVLHFYTPSVERIKPDLKRYGSFMGISLYPKDLLNKIDRFLISYEKFRKRLLKIKSVGKEQCDAEFDEYLWCHVLGIEQLKGSYLKKSFRHTSV